MPVLVHANMHDFSLIRCADSTRGLTERYLTLTECDPRSARILCTRGSSGVGQRDCPLLYQSGRVVDHPPGRGWSQQGPRHNIHHPPDPHVLLPRAPLR